MTAAVLVGLCQRPNDASMSALQQRQMQQRKHHCELQANCNIGQNESPAAHMCNPASNELMHRGYCSPAAYAHSGSPVHTPALLPAATFPPSKCCHLCVLQLACIIKLLPVAEEGFNVTEGPAGQLLLQSPCCKLLLLLLLTRLSVRVFTACPADKQDTTTERLQSTCRRHSWVLCCKVLWRFHLECEQQRQKYTPGRLDNWHRS